MSAQYPNAEKHLKKQKLKKQTKHVHQLGSILLQIGGILPLHRVPPIADPISFGFPIRWTAPKVYHWPISHSVN